MANGEDDEDFLLPHGAKDLFFIRLLLKGFKLQGRHLHCKQEEGLHLGSWSLLYGIKKEEKKGFNHGILKRR